MKTSRIKRISLLVFVLTFVLICSMVFVACGGKSNNNGNNDKTTYTITFDTQGGSEVSPLVLEEGATIILPNEPTKDGYEFLDWYLDSDGTTEFSANVISSNITLYAIWGKWSTGLSYTLNTGNASYYVSSIGICTDNCVIVPSKYGDKPVTSIGAGAFSWATFSSMILPNTVTSIGDGAFYNCSSLTSITIPNSVTSIASYGFKGCTSLTSITYKGTKAQWDAITKGDSWNLYMSNYTIHCTDGDIN